MNSLNEIPAGTKPLLPEETCQKRRIERVFTDIFKRWSYQEIAVPTFDYYEAVRASGATEEEQLYKFIDYQGKIMVLRPDMTTPIARLVAGRLEKEKLPLRYFYSGNVFRYEAPQAGRQREFHQVGVELIGSSSPKADAEVIALAIECLLSLGLKDFRIGLGQVNLIKETLRSVFFKESILRRMEKVISRKDYVGLDRLIRDYDLDNFQRDMINKLLRLQGGSEVFAAARKLTKEGPARKALENLENVYEALRPYKVQDYVFLDLGLLRDMHYYTGIVFEGYTAGLGFPVCGGGRYDNLLGVFGSSSPATGFAMGIERLMLAVGNDREQRELAVDYLVGGRDYQQVIAKASELRAAGYRVAVDVEGLTREKLEDLASCKGIQRVLEVSVD